MTKREAKRVAYAILVCEAISTIVAAQLDGANIHLDGLSDSDKQKIIAAAEEIASEMYRRAGNEMSDIVVGDRPLPARWKGNIANGIETRADG